MKAQIKVESFDSSIWGAMQPMNHREVEYLVEEKDRISTTGLEDEHVSEIAGIRVNAVELGVRPDLTLHAEGQSRAVGALTLEVGESARLQTQTLDAWGNWIVSLKAIV